MAKVPGSASAFAGCRRIVEIDIGLRLRNLAEFFNSLLGRVPVNLAVCRDDVRFSQKAAEIARQRNMSR